VKLGLTIPFLVVLSMPQRVVILSAAGKECSIVIVQRFSKTQKLSAKAAGVAIAKDYQV